MNSTSHEEAVRRAAKSVVIAPKDAVAIVAALSVLDKPSQQIFNEAQGLALAVHLATFLQRRKSGDSLPDFDTAIFNEVSETSLQLASTALRDLAGCDVDEVEALLVAVHRDSALLTRRSHQ